MAQPEYPKAVDDLEAPEPEAIEETISTLEPAREGGRDRGRYVLAVLAVLVLVLALLLVRANAQIEGLEGTMAALEGELERSRSAVAAHEEHLGEIRGEVDVLVGHLGSLDRLVDRDPTLAPSSLPFTRPPTPPSALSSEQPAEPASGGSGPSH